MNLIPGVPTAPPELIERRLATCRACEFHGTAPLLKTEFCKACGCPLANKTRFLKTSCPKGKW